MVEEFLIGNINKPYFERKLKESIESKDWGNMHPLMYVAPAAVMGSIPIAVSKVFKVKSPGGIIPATVAMTALGIASSVMGNRMIKGKRDHNLYDENLNAVLDAGGIPKQASWSSIGAIGKLMGGAGKFIWGGTKELGRGLAMPILKHPKGTKLSDKALSLVSKGAVGYGLYKGTQAIKKKTIKPGYTQFLRNQILAGNINPNEVSSGQMRRVVELGI